MKPAVFLVKPRTTFKHPFKYNINTIPINEFQNKNMMDYFNYGFHEDTMNIYEKFVKRTIESTKLSNKDDYDFNEPKLTRLND